MAVSTINERLKAVRKSVGLSQKDFAEGIYLSHSFYSKIETGSRKGNERVYELISNKYKVNKDWIITGKGSMVNENAPDIELEELIGVIKQLDPLFKKCIIQQIKLMANLHRQSKEQGQKTPIGPP
jgi:transcriptional regulator with XRE-family HTH domain